MFCSLFTWIMLGMLKWSGSDWHQPNPCRGETKPRTNEAAVKVCLPQLCAQTVPRNPTEESFWAAPDAMMQFDHTSRVISQLATPTVRLPHGETRSADATGFAVTQLPPPSVSAQSPLVASPLFAPGGVAPTFPRLAAAPVNFAPPLFAPGGVAPTFPSLAAAPVNFAPPLFAPVGVVPTFPSLAAAPVNFAPPLFAPGGVISTTSPTLTVFPQARVFPARTNRLEGNRVRLAPPSLVTEPLSATIQSPTSAADLLPEADWISEEMAHAQAQIPIYSHYYAYSRTGVTPPSPIPTPVPAQYKPINVNNLVLGANGFYGWGFRGRRAKVANIEGGFAMLGGTLAAHESLRGLDQPSNLQYFFPRGAMSPALMPVQKRDHPTQVAFNIVGLGSGQPHQLGIAPHVHQGNFWSGSFVNGFNPDGTFQSDSLLEYQIYREAIVFGIRKRPANRVDVVNSSWGYDHTLDPSASTQGDDSRVYDALIQAVNDGNPALAIPQRGVTVVFAAGNSGRLGNNTVTFPGTSYNVFTVGSVGPYNPGHMLFSEPSVFSSRGPVSFFVPTNAVGDGAIHPRLMRAKVEIVAPGDTEYLPIPSLGTDRYDFASGTSFAAPDVTGGIALMADYARDRFAGILGGIGTALDTRVVKAVMMNAADKTAGWDNGQVVLRDGNNRPFYRTTQSLDYITGAGRLNLENTYRQYAYFDGALGRNHPFATHGVVRPSGWAKDSIAKPDVDNISYVHHYHLASSPVPPQQPFPKYMTLTATLNWLVDRPLLKLAYNPALGPTTEEREFADLDLRIFTSPQFAQLNGRYVARSESITNNTEHLSILLPETGFYTIEVAARKSIWNFDRAARKTTYGLAWMLEPSRVISGGNPAFISTKNFDMIPNSLISPPGTPSSEGLLTTSITVLIRNSLYMGMDPFETPAVGAPGHAVGKLTITTGARLEVSNTAYLGHQQLITLNQGTLVGGALVMQSGNTIQATGTGKSTLGFTRISLNGPGNIIRATTNTSTLVMPPFFNKDDVQIATINLKNHQLTLGGAGNLDISSQIIGIGSILKTGDGLAFLRGINTYSGGTTVSAGTLSPALRSLAPGHSATGSGVVFVDSGAELIGYGPITGHVAIAGDPGMNGGTVGAGDFEGPDVVTLRLLGGLTMNAGSILQVGIWYANASDGTPGSSTTGMIFDNPISNDYLELNGAVVIPNDIRVKVNIMDVIDPFKSYSFRIAQGAGNQSMLNVPSNRIQFLFTDVPIASASLTGDAAGMIYLNFATVPEPALGLLLMALGLPSLGRARRMA